jgi:hypothetical protein
MSLGVERFLGSLDVVLDCCSLYKEINVDSISSKVVSKVVGVISLPSSWHIQSLMNVIFGKVFNTFSSQSCIHSLTGFCLRSIMASPR